MFCIPEFTPAPAAGSSDCRDLQICLQSFINGERDGGRKFKALLPSELLFVSYAPPPLYFHLDLSRDVISDGSMMKGKMG